jgi:small-conductance mechanosensitive channel
MISDVTQWVQANIGLSEAVQYKLLATVLIALVLWLGHGFLLRMIYRRATDVRVRYRWRKTATYVAAGLNIILLAALWLPAFGSIGTFIGLLSAGLTIALKDLVADMAGWIFILWRRPFEVGDRIEIGNDRGDVIDVRVFQFTLMEIGNWVQSDQSTGRIIHVPNGKVLSEVVANYSKGFQFIWNEIPVLVTFESDWRKAKQILLDIARKHAEQLSAEAERRVQEAARKFLIFYSKLTPIVYTSVRDSGVLLTVRYLCKPQRRRGSEEAIWEDILDAFRASPDVDFAYPTQRFYDNQAEGRLASSGPPAASSSDAP